jgi:hypothetical protein
MIAAIRSRNNNNKNPNNQLRKFPPVLRNEVRISPVRERASEGPKHFKLARLILPQRAETGHSLQAQTKLGNLKKADAQGISPSFCCANAANGGYDPTTLPQGLLD